MLKRLAFFLAAFLLFSCLPHHKAYTSNFSRSAIVRVMPVYIDSRFTGDDKIALTQAIDTWSYAFNNQIKFEVHYNVGGWTSKELEDVYFSKGIAIIKLSEADHDVIPTLSSDPFAAKKVLAWVNRIGGDRIHVLRDRMGDGDVYYILLHELGHIFGVMHTSADELMQPNYYKNNQQCIDQNTASKAADHMGIHKDTMNWCS